MSILDPTFREGLRAKRAKTSPQSCNRAAKVVTDRDIPDTGGHRDYGQNTDGPDEPDRKPVTVGDPDNDIDPDDRATLQMQQSNDVDAPPPMPASWWTHVALDADEAPVSPEDIRTVFWHIRYRLAGRETTTTAFPALQDATPAREATSEVEDSGQDTSRDTSRSVQMFDAGAAKIWNEKLDSVSTVGQLHEAIEALGPNAWSMFVGCWLEAAGIEQPEHKQKPVCVPTPTAEQPGTPDTPLPRLPSSACPMEEGLRSALLEMPPRVAAFLLHVPRDPPAWRYQESAGERAERQALENLGAWTG